jgi:type IV pilus assembly protein PilW
MQNKGYKSMPPGSHKEKGFSLIELMIAMALSGIVIGAIYNLYIGQSRSYVIQDQVAEMQQNARVAMDMMVRDIRMAGFDPTREAGAGFVAATSNSIQFTADRNSDGDLDDADEDITYSLYDSNDADTLDDDLGRDTGGGNQPVAENISSLTFSYFDEDGNSTADLSQIRSVEITLTAQTAERDPDYTPNGGYRTRTLETVVKVRNMGL